MPMTLPLPYSRYSQFTAEQRQRIEAAANKLPAERRAAFRERVKQALRTPMGRGVVTDAGLGVALSIAAREFSGQPR
jgi:hypothetical protein